MRPVSYLVTRGLGILITGAADVTLKGAVYQFLEANLSTSNVYHRELPANPTYPAVTIDVVDDVSIGRSHDSGVLPFREARVQISTYSDDIEEAEDLLTELFTLLGNYDGSLGVAGYTDVSVRYEMTNPDLEFENESTLKTIEGRSMDFKVIYK